MSSQTVCDDMSVSIVGETAMVLHNFSIFIEKGFAEILKHLLLHYIFSIFTICYVLFDMQR